MHSWYLDGVPESKVREQWQDSHTDTHSSMPLEREWVVQKGRILGLVTASKPNEKKGRAADEKPMNNENQKAARVERVQQRARDDLVKKYHK